MLAFSENREIFALAAAMFAAAFVFGLLAHGRSRGAAKARVFRSAEMILLAAGGAALSWAIFERGVADENFPVGNIFEIFQVLGWCAIFSLGFLRAVWSLRVPAVFASGTAAALCSLGFLNAAAWDAPGAAGTGNPWIGVHAAAATIGYACFTAAAIVWLAYLLQNSALRKRRTHRFFSALPDLESLDRIAGRMCAAGLVFLGVALVLGAIVMRAGGHLESTLAIYKISFSAVLFLSFSLLAFLRRSRKISAKIGARAGISVFVAGIVLLGGIACIHNFSAREKCVPAENFSEEETVPAAAFDTDSEGISR